MGLGDRIERIRAAKGMSRAELGRRSQLSERHLRRLVHVDLKRGASMDTLQRLALALEVSVTRLVTDVEEEAA